MFKDSKILVGITGSIAAYKVYDLIRLLRRNGAEVRCVVTHAGMHFVNKLTLETLLNHRIYTDLFDEYADKRAVHVPLADWADVVVVVPATADILAKVSVGIADELLTSVILATQANVLFAPAMHSNMWNNPITQDNIKKLTSRGFGLINPTKGALSDGSKGIGHIASQETIMEAIKKAIDKKP